MAAPAPDRGRRLGRGLDFLLATQPGTDAAEQVEIGLGSVRPNPWQPRKEFDEAALASLTESVRQHGILQPIAVRRKGDTYELIAGERRVLAARRAGLERVPAIVRNLDDSQMLVAALIENVQRSDLNPIERARALKRLVEEQQKSHDEVAQLAGLARSTVSNSIRLLDLDPPSLEALAAGRITEGHGRALLAEPDPERRSALLRAIEGQKFSVRKAEDSTTTNGAKQKGAVQSEDARRLERALSERLATSVRIQERGTRGRLVITYTSLKEFERLYTRLAGAPPPVE
jgi:ParB family chromosome partitioning protein